MKRITVNDLLAAAYASLGVVALFPPTTHTERALGICLIVLSWLFWREARDFEKLLKISNDLADSNTRLIRDAANRISKDLADSSAPHQRCREPRKS